MCCLHVSKFIKFNIVSFDYEEDNFYSDALFH